MSERPFMQLYVSDFVGDTLHLSSEQVGVYLLLLMAMWNADGSLPDDDAKLSRVARLSLKKWRALRPELVEFFTVADGKITHGRLSRELQKSERQSQSRASAGARGGVATALKNNKSGPANAVAGPQHSPEPYRKKGDKDFVPTEGVVLDRCRADHEHLWLACERIMRTTVPEYLSKHTFPSEVVAQARKELAH